VRKTMLVPFMCLVAAAMISSGARAESDEKPAETNKNGKIVQIFRDDKKVVSKFDEEPAAEEKGTAADRPEAEKVADEKTEEPPAPAQDKSKPKPDRRFRMGVGVSYDLANTLRFSSASGSDSNGSYSGTLTYNTDPAGGLVIEGSWTGPQAWGFNVGLNLEAKRKIKSWDAIFGGANSSGSVTGDAGLTVAVLYGNAIYRWDSVYVPFGLNIAGGSLENAPTALVDMHGSAGVQAGVGFMLGEHFSLEALVRVLGFIARKNITGNVTVDLGLGTMAGGVLVGKFLF